MFLEDSVGAVSQKDASEPKTVFICHLLGRHCSHVDERIATILIFFLSSLSQAF